MNRLRKAILATSLTAALAPAALADAARPWVDLAFAPVAEPCVTRFLDVELWVYSNDPNTYTIGAVTAILEWDPNTLQLLGRINDGPYTWLYSDFPVNADGLNLTFADGNAFYQAYAQLGVPALATPSGLKIVTFHFRKLRVGNATPIATPAAYGLYSRTLVLSGTLPNTDILAPDGLASVMPIPDARGDINCDGVINFDDIDPFVAAFSGQAYFNSLYPGCNWFNSDVNCDGTVDFDDIDPWVALLGQ